MHAFEMVSHKDCLIDYVIFWILDTPSLVLTSFSIRNIVFIRILWIDVPNEWVSSELCFLVIAIWWFVTSTHRQLIGKGLLDSPSFFRQWTKVFHFLHIVKVLANLATFFLSQLSFFTESSVSESSEFYFPLFLSCLACDQFFHFEHVLRIRSLRSPILLVFLDPSACFLWQFFNRECLSTIFLRNQVEPLRFVNEFWIVCFRIFILVLNWVFDCMNTFFYVMLRQTFTFNRNFELVAWVKTLNCSNIHKCDKILPLNFQNKLERVLFELFIFFFFEWAWFRAIKCRLLAKF